MKLKYLNHYNKDTQSQVIKLIEAQKLGTHLLKKYPSSHKIKNDKAPHAPLHNWASPTYQTTYLLPLKVQDTPYYCSAF